MAPLTESDPFIPAITVVTPVIDHLLGRFLAHATNNGTRLEMVTRPATRDCSSFGAPAVVSTRDWTVDSDLRSEMSGSPLLVVSGSVASGTSNDRLDPGEAQRVVRSCAEAGTNLVVVLSSTDVYGISQEAITPMTPARPTDWVGEITFEVEQSVREAGGEYGLTVCCLRFPHVYGPRSVLFEYVRQGFVPVSGDLDTWASHLHIVDAARALYLGVRRGLSCDLPVADFRPTRWSHVVSLIQEVRHDVEFHVAPPWSIRRALKLLDLDDMAIPSLITPGSGPGWRRDQRIDARESWRTLGGKPLYPSFQSGLDSVLAEDRVASIAS